MYSNENPNRIPLISNKIAYRTQLTPPTLNASQKLHVKFVHNQNDNIFWMFRISFMCYSTVGFIVAMVIGQTISWMTGDIGQNIDENLLIPFFQSTAFRERIQRKSNETRYVTIDQMLIEMTKIKTIDCENVDKTSTAELEPLPAN